MKPVMEVDMEQTQLGQVEGAGLGELLGHSHQYSADIAMPDAELALATPQQLLDKDFVASLGPFTQPYPNTRSRANLHAGESTMSPRPSQALRRLQTAIKSSRNSNHRASLEDARDLRIQETDNQAYEEDVEENAKSKLRRAPSLRPELGRLRVNRRSERIKSRHQQQDRSLMVRKRVVRKPQAKPRVPPARHLRRSARLSKPLTEFHKYSSLPAEIRMIIWEEAISPRLVYIRNRQVPHWLPKIHASQPTWFTADHTSEYVAGQRYRKMFGLQDPTDDRPPQEFQNVNPNVDIIVLEPCCNGCRGFWCTRQQFSEDDRNAVRFLAIQTDSPHLAPFARPCWETISMSFPNTETLYLMRKPLKGEQPREKAMIRIEEDEHETGLRARFNEWKKGSGKIKLIERLEFVAVVDKEPDSTNVKNRYRHILDRKTHLPEDIIMG